MWLSVSPTTMNGTELSAQEFQDPGTELSAQEFQDANRSPYS
jgi:hypothetical protein